MLLRQLLALALLLGSGALFAPGCSLVGEDCEDGAKRCVGSTGGYETCIGGEGQYSWYSDQCPGVDPVCTDESSSVICSDRATLTTCSAERVLSGEAPTSPDCATLQAKPRVVDVDGDGLLDLLYPFADGVLEVARGHEGGTFADPESLSLTIQGHALDALPADLDADGIEDLLVISDEPAEIYAFLGDAPLEYHLAARYFAGSLALGGAGDLDSDGRDEVVSPGSYGVDVLSQLGEAELEVHTISLEQPDRYSTNLIASAELVEANGKPPLEIALRGDQDITIFSRASDGSFAPSATIGSVSWEGGALGDLDGDGRTDLLWHSANVERTSLDVRLAKDGFSASSSLALVYEGATYLGDFDGDGDVDVFVAATNANGDPMCSVFKGDGKGKFGSAQLFSLPQDTHVVDSGDVGNDGTADVVLQDATGAILLVRGGCLGE